MVLNFPLLLQKAPLGAERRGGGGPSVGTSSIVLLLLLLPNVTCPVVSLSVSLPVFYLEHLGHLLWLVFTLLIGGRRTDGHSCLTCSPGGSIAAASFTVLLLFLLLQPRQQLLLLLSSLAADCRLRREGKDIAPSRVAAAAVCCLSTPPPRDSQRRRRRRPRCDRTSLASKQDRQDGSERASSC